MTYLDYIYIAILVFGSAIAASQGLIKTVFGFASTLVSLIVAYMFYPVFSEILIKSTGVYSFIQGKIGEALDLETLAKSVVTKQDSIDMIKGLEVPSFLVDQLLENNNVEIYKLLGLSSLDDISSYISGFLATIAINALAFMVIFIVAIILIGFLAYFLDLIAKLPVLKQINHIAGFAVGVLLSFIGLWVVSLVLFFITNMQGTTELQLIIEQSPFVQIFYGNNLILDILTDISKTWLR